MGITTFLSCSFQQFILFLTHTDSDPTSNESQEKRVQIVVNKSV